MLDDGESYTLKFAEDGDATGLYWVCDLGDSTDGALVAMVSSGSVVSQLDIVADGSGGETWAGTDSGTGYAIYVSAGDVVIKNRSGDDGVTVYIARLA